ncbi:MAG: hypothetical protein ACRC4U_09530, partial [Shewanella sp.]
FDKGSTMTWLPFLLNASTQGSPPSLRYPFGLRVPLTANALLRFKALARLAKRRDPARRQRTELPENQVTNWPRGK